MIDYLNNLFHEYLLFLFIEIEVYYNLNLLHTYIMKIRQTLLTKFVLLIILEIILGQDSLHTSKYVE